MNGNLEDLHPSMREIMMEDSTYMASQSQDVIDFYSNSENINKKYNRRKLILDLPDYNAS